ncbi:MAG: DUF4199 domain-containing protein [Crocinitomicaceae bacterium]|nr:DUF4199 domain-containing protein [Crocinitomicaceae bacterium]
MKITIKTGLIFAAIWILMRMIFFWSGIKGAEIALTMLNSLCLISAISVGLYLFKRQTSDSNALMDIKEGMSAGLPYTVIVSIFLYFFYNTIDPEYTKHKVEDRMTAVEEYIAEDANWANVKENSTYETYTKEEFLASERESAETFNSAKFVTIISLLGGLLLGTFYSIFVTAIYRKIVFR